MNRLQFAELCSDTAFALQMEAVPAFAIEDGVWSFGLEGVEVSLVLDDGDEPDAVHCYIDLGEPSPNDRGLVCEQLLSLNFQYREAVTECYAFGKEANRVFYRRRLGEPDRLTGNFLAETIRFHLEESQEVREMVAHPARHAHPATDQPAPNGAFAGHFI